MCSRYASTSTGAKLREERYCSSSPAAKPIAASEKARTNLGVPDLREPVKRLGEQVVARRNRDLAPVPATVVGTPRLDAALSTTSSWINVAVCRTSMAVEAVRRSSGPALPCGR
jgi:hypothetical protein